MLKKNKNSNPMKKIIFFLFFPILLFSQDLDFKVLSISENETRILAKRESQTEVWVKKIEKDTKKKNKNGKIITIKGKETLDLYKCDCDENSIKKINSESNNNSIIPLPFSNEQLIIDFTCSNLEYKKFIGENSDFRYYLGSKKRKGNFYDVWIKVDDKDKVNNVYDTGIFFISKIRFDCVNKKSSPIIDFIYNQDYSLDDLNPIQYNRVLGMRSIEGDDALIMIYKSVCFEN